MGFEYATHTWSFGDVQWVARSRPVGPMERPFFSKRFFYNRKQFQDMKFISWIQISFLLYSCTLREVWFIFFCVPDILNVENQGIISNFDYQVEQDSIQSSPSYENKTW